MSYPLEEVNKRRTFAIISHPDAGKTTITEKVLLYGNAIQKAGSVKGKGSAQHAKSDWMEMEKQRGISITTSVMQFPYNECLVNLLDTPGHEDFSEDTYRTLTAVDSCLMVIDSAKGVEERTIKLMEVTRLRDTPIITFMNKLDRDIRDPMELLDEVESVLKIHCAPITWPIGCGKLFKGVYHLYKDETYLYQSGQGSTIQEVRIVKGLNSPELDAAVGDDLAQQLRDELELVKGASNEFDLDLFLSGELTPVFFGTALGNFGVDHFLDGLTEWAPAPQARQADTRKVSAEEEKFTGFVFKIQANMDPRHRDRIAFVRIVSGEFERGMSVNLPRTGKSAKLSNVTQFMAESRENVTNAVAGDIIGVYDTGTYQVGDTLTVGKNKFEFEPLPTFTPEIFMKVSAKNVMKQKSFHKGIEQLVQEGAIQLYTNYQTGEYMLGAVGQLQFEVFKHRMENEYNAEVVMSPMGKKTVRWIKPEDLDERMSSSRNILAKDRFDQPVFLFENDFALRWFADKYPDVTLEEKM